MAEIAVAAATMDDIKNHGAHRRAPISKKTMLTATEIGVLEEHFLSVTPKPNSTSIQSLVARIGRADFTEKKCRVWFMNRRSFGEKYIISRLRSAPTSGATNQS